MNTKQYPAVKRAMSARMLKFCEEYAISFKLQEAATKAGYSPKTASAQAYQMIRDPRIQDYLNRTSNQRMKAVTITVERVLKHLQDMAFFDIKQCLTPDGDILPPSQWPEIAPKIVTEYTAEVTKVVSGLDSTSTVTVKRIKIPDRVKNTENLGRYLAMFTDKVQRTDTQEVKVFFIPKFDDPGGMPADETRQVEYEELPVKIHNREAKDRWLESKKAKFLGEKKMN